MSNSDNIFILISIILFIIIILLILKQIGSITIHSPNYYISNKTKNVLLSIIISILLLIPIFKKSLKVGLMSGFIISIIIFIIITNSGVYNLQNVVPSTDYPPPTHLGLDGVTLQTMVSGTNQTLIDNNHLNL